MYPGDMNGNLELIATESDFFSGDLPEGDYVFTITACGLDGQTEDGTFTWTLDYPCNNNPCPTLPLQEYTIED